MIVYSPAVIGFIIGKSTVRNRWIAIVEIEHPTAAFGIIVCKIAVYYGWAALNVEHTATQIIQICIGVGIPLADCKSI